MCLIYVQKYKMLDLNCIFLQFNDIICMLYKVA